MLFKLFIELIWVHLVRYFFLSCICHHSSLFSDKFLAEIFSQFFSNCFVLNFLSKLIKNIEILIRVVGLLFYDIIQNIIFLLSFKQKFSHFDTQFLASYTLLLCFPLSALPFHASIQSLLFDPLHDMGNDVLHKFASEFLGQLLFGSASASCAVNPLQQTLFLFGQDDTIFLEYCRTLWVDEQLQFDSKQHIEKLFVLLCILFGVACRNILGLSLLSFRKHIEVGAF